MPATRTYYLGDEEFDGWAGPVRVTYNSYMRQNLEGGANPVLKRALEDISVQAALERSFATVHIRSSVHVTTVDESGQRFNDDPHITIECSGITGHVYCTGFAYTELPPYWYSDMEFSHVKWEDRTPSTQASYYDSPVVEQTPAARVYYAGHEPNPPSPPFPQWVARPAYVAAPGVEYQWWDGTRFTHHMASPGETGRSPNY
ncbi:hypothetical protein B0J15DRAFT_503675 [Fusarium solani]|uniref:Uncharacterized protein n=1 Tax=Fusarium solani TaxID=169388 RepID=A0A9P9JYI2_FUSSL|nr:uncharacterized protein B0J15DRAFT_503675 [Fusarium solani]KAH7237360.1 hypothetical protein B0J15DRAFT_503675 [Fusarium solani]